MPLQQAAEFLSESISGWEQKGRLNADLLLALCQLTVKRPEDGKKGFTSVELAEEVSAIRGRAWPQGGSADAESTSKPVREQWKHLQKLWGQKAQGVRDAATDQSLQVIAVPDKTQGGGAGLYTRHFLRLEPIEDVAPFSPAQESASKEGQVRYICEDLKDAGPVARTISAGWEMVGWRRWTTVGILTGALILGMLVALLVALSFQNATSSGQALKLSVFGGIILGAMWFSLAGVFMLPARRITVAPWWIQSPFNDRLLVWQCPPQHSVKAIKAARYTADCPVCGDKVVVKSGGLEFWGRMVGRCDSAPNEHVFSFDHVTRRGTSLR